MTRVPRLLFYINIHLELMDIIDITMLLKIYLSLVLILSTSLIGCSEGKVVEEKSLQNRNGIFYEVNSQTPFTGKSVTYYDADNEVIKVKQMQGEMTIRDGLVDGYMKSYYQNGQLQQEVEFKKGAPHGKYKVYYEDGQLHKEGEVNNAKKDGIQKSYHQNGQLENGKSSARCPLVPV